MKRLSNKIGKRISEKSEEKVPQAKIQMLLAVLLLLSFSSCQKSWYGSDGLPGNAYLSLSWHVSEPTYLDAGTYAIPSVFYWEDLYKISPGYYDLYYEGSVWNGMYLANYAWEVMYEIREISGERGDWYYNGLDGPDNYFSIECNPSGPFIRSDYKSTALDEKYSLVEESESEIIVKQKGEGMDLIITYKKVSPRTKTK